MTDGQWTASEIIAAPGAPRDLFKHLSVSAYRTGKGGKPHAQYNCAARIGNRFLSQAYVTVAAVTADGACGCLQDIQNQLKPILAHAAIIAELAHLAEEPHSEPTSPLEALVRVTALRHLTQHAPQARTNLLTALKKDPKKPICGDPADTALLDKVDTWATGSIRTAREALTVLEASLGENPQREAALCALRPTFHEQLATYTSASRAFPALSHALAHPADLAWHATLNAGRTHAEVREQVVATIEGARVPSDRRHLPTDEPVPAGLTLGEAMDSMWRTAARDQIGRLADQLLGMLDTLGKDESASLLLLWGEPRPGSHAAALLDGAQHIDTQDGDHVYLTDTVIARAVESVADADVAALPAPVPARYADIDDAAAKDILGGTYVRTLLRFIAEETMSLEDAVVAAMGVVAEPASLAG